MNSSQIILPGDGGTEGGLTITLGEGDAQPDPIVRLPVADAELLTADTIQPILDRLPPLEAEEGDEQEFRLPPESLPPPRTGETVEETFPPAPIDVTEPETEDGPLAVLRFAPEGEIPIAPFLNVTFNQPMVPLGTLEQLAAEDVPVKLTPAIPGVWKWLGTKTLSFEHRADEIDRFPMATEFTVEIPAGSTSATGGKLAEAVTWTFSTPAPQVVSFMPSGGPQPTAPLLFVSFNQRIDPEAVLATITVTAGGDPYDLTLADEDVIVQDEAIARAVKNLNESGRGDQWLAFRAEQEFPTNTTVVVNVGPGTPSAEGPRTSGHVQSYSFQTYAPLRVVEHQCGYGECPPLAPFTIRFNNPIDQDAFSQSLVTAEPEIPGMDVDLFGANMIVQGATQGRTTYEVTLSGEIRDIFGQTLGEDVTLSFEVGSAFPMLTGPNDAYIMLDPSSASPVFTVYSVNYEKLRVRAYAVTPDDWQKYLTYRQQYFGQENSPEPPGKEVLNQEVIVQAEPDALAETSIDLTAALGGKETGHLIVIADIPTTVFNQGNQRGGRPDGGVQTWVQVTQIGLDAFVDSGNMVAWANALADGAPLADVELELQPVDVTATTAEDGTALLPLTEEVGQLLVARQGDDVAILPPNKFVWGGDGWRAIPQQDELRWHVFDDRAMYRPGEEVHVKGFVRRIGRTQDGDVELIGGAQNSIRYKLFGPQGNEILDGTATVTGLGGFDMSFTLPENINLGSANLQMSLAGNVSNLDSREFWHTLQVQEFRRPEFEVSAGNETTGPYFLGDEAVVFVSAQYFAGGPLPNAETFWNVSSSATNYSPPNWPDFTFGTWVPWWRFYDDFGYSGGDGGGQSYNAVTDPAGEHYLSMTFEDAAEPRPYSVVASATVMDVNRQAWSASTTLMVHPADLYVGLRSDRTFVELGEPLEIEAIVTDIDGNAVAGRTIEMRAARLDWEFVDGEWQEVEADIQECSVESTAEPVTCSFVTETGGSFRITATVTDDEGPRERESAHPLGHRRQASARAQRGAGRSPTDSRSGNV